MQYVFHGRDSSTSHTTNDRLPARRMKVPTFRNRIQPGAFIRMRLGRESNRLRPDLLAHPCEVVS